MAYPINEKQQLYDLSNFTILVVEDSAYMQDLMSSMLKAFGVGEIMVCESAEEAIELLMVTQSKTKSRYVTKVDIVLTDWLMPKGSGKDLLQWIRKNEKDSIKYMPVIVVSGYTTEVITNMSRDMGAHEILVKPVSATLLASRICSVIDNPRPFIQTGNFFGPDRRRQTTTFTGKERRVTQPKVIEVK